jgi:hypothetical protein
VAAAAAVSVAIAGAWRAARHDAPPRDAALPAFAAAPSLMLEVRVDAGPGEPARPGPGDGRALALNAMTDAQRARAAGVLDRLADRMERERNPLVEDLDDDGDDAWADAERLVSERLPALTAASALSAARWTSADGRLVVRATTACAPDARCVPLACAKPGECPPDDALAARARFLAWPVAYGLVLRPPAACASDVVEALRAPVEGSRIALVVRDQDLHGVRFSDALPALVESAARIGRLAPRDAPAAQVLRRVTEVDAAALDDLGWLALPDGAVLVVPRLGALATIGAFADEVRARALSVPTCAQDGQSVHAPAKRAPRET